MPDPLDTLAAAVEAMSPRPWRRPDPLSQPGQVVGAGAVLFTANEPNASGTALLRNVAPELIAMVRAAELYVRADEEGAPWPAPSLTLRGALRALTAAVREEQQRHDGR